MFKLTRKKSLALILFGAFSLSLTQAAFAESSSSERSLTGFFRRLFNYPVKATQETAGMTANTLENTGEKVIAKTGENTAGIVTGDLPKAGNLVADNVTGTLETVGQTASETAQIPVKAAEEEQAAQ